MLKRILSIIVACSLLLTVIPAFADESAEAVVAEYELVPGAYDIVTALGICEYEEKDMNATITRGEFAKVVSLLAGYGEGNKSANMFSDVPEAHQYAGYINGLAKAGVVSGYKGTGYSPDTAVSFNEAITTVVRAMGYAAKAENQGGYPYGYVAVAQRLGLLENLTASNAAITKAEVIQLAFNALEADAMVAEGLLNGEVSYGTYRDYTLGDYVFGMAHITGKVEAVDISSIRGENDLDSEQILIDGIEILAEEKVLWDYLGYEVDAWYTTDKSGVKNLVHIEKTDYNKVIEIPVTDIVSINKGEVVYYDINNKKEEASFKIAGPVIFNTVATYEAFNEDMIADADGGVVTLISNDGDKVADVIVVEKYKDYVISALYSSQMTLYDKFDDTKKIKLDVTVDDPYTIIYDSKGKEISFADLALGNVISVYDSMTDADQKFIKAIAHSASVEGVVEEVCYVDDVAEVMIDGATYRLTKRCFTNRKQFLKAGSSVKLILNMEGDACDMVSVSSRLEFVYIIAHDETKGMDANTVVKVFKPDGSFGVYEFAKNVTIDTNVYKDGYRNGVYVIDALKKSCNKLYEDEEFLLADSIAQPVQIRLSEGKIVAIDTILNSDGNKATRTDVKGFDMLYHVGKVRGRQNNIEGGKTKDRSDGYVYMSGDSYNFGAKFVTKSTTPTLRVPSVADKAGSELLLDEEMYSATTAIKVFPRSSKIRFFADAFSTKDNEFVAEYIVEGMKSDSEGGSIGTGSVSENIRTSIVKDVRSAIMPDESVGYCIVVGTTSGENKIYCKYDYTFKMGDDNAKVNQLHEGDVIRYEVGMNGFVSALELCFRTETGVLYQTDGIHKLGRYKNAEICITYGYVHQSLSGVFTFLEGSLGYDAFETTDQPYYNLVSAKGSIYIYDFNELPGKRVKSATSDDIMGYDAVRTDGSFIYMNAEKFMPDMILVVNGHDYAPKTEGDN